MALAPIVLGVDGSANSREGCRVAAELAAATGAAVVAVHVFEPLHWLGKVPPPVDFHALKERIADQLNHEWCALLEASGVELDCRVVEGSPAEALAAVGDEVGAWMIIVGVRGHSPLRELVSGSTASELPHIAHRPVLLVPPVV